MTIKLQLFLIVRIEFDANGGIGDDLKSIFTWDSVRCSSIVQTRFKEAVDEAPFLWGGIQ